MLNSIVDAVSVVLNEEFGDEYEIYGEEVEQGFKEPCFFINIISASIRRYPGNRYLRHAALCVQFFPGSIEKNRECEEAAERMERCLEYIGSDKDLQHGTEMNHEVHEGVRRREMAVKKKMDKANDCGETDGRRMFEKEQLVLSARYAARRDMMSALLENGRKYTVEEVDNIIKDFEERVR